MVITVKYHSMKVQNDKTCLKNNTINVNHIIMHLIASWVVFWQVGSVTVVNIFLSQ